MLRDVVLLSKPFVMLRKNTLHLDTCELPTSIKYTEFDLLPFCYRFPFSIFILYKSWDGTVVGQHAEFEYQ